MSFLCNCILTKELFVYCKLKGICLKVIHYSHYMTFCEWIYNNVIFPRYNFFHNKYVRNVKISKIYQNISKVRFCSSFWNFEMQHWADSSSGNWEQHNLGWLKKKDYISGVIQSLSEFDAVVSVQGQISIPQMTVLLFT